MPWKQAGADADSRIGAMAERVNRRLGRRAALRAGILSGVASVAALAAGENPAAAYPYSPGCGPTHHCSGCRHPAGCPAGYELCKQHSLCGTPPSYGGDGGGVANKQGYWCEWPGGIWESADHLGRGYGYTLCYDCVRSPVDVTHCHGWCTCPSECFCCNCTSLSDVRAEQKRTGQYLASTSAEGG